jgi:hypothetical protein
LRATGAEGSTSKPLPAAAGCAYNGDPVLPKTKSVRQTRHVRGLEQRPIEVQFPLPVIEPTRPCPVSLPVLGEVDGRANRSGQGDGSFST